MAETIDRARPTGVALRREDQRRLAFLAARDGLSKSATVRLLIATAWRDVSKEAENGGLIRAPRRLASLRGDVSEGPD